MTPPDGYDVTLAGRLRMTRTVLMRAETPGQAAADAPAALRSAVTCGMDPGHPWQSKTDAASGLMKDVQVNLSVPVTAAGDRRYLVPLSGWMNVTTTLSVQAENKQSAGTQALNLARQKDASVRWTGRSGRTLAGQPDEIDPEVSVCDKDPEDPLRVTRLPVFTLTSDQNGDALSSEHHLEMHAELSPSGLRVYLGRPGRAADIGSLELSLDEGGDVHLELYDREQGLDSGPSDDLVFPLGADDTQPLNLPWDATDSD